MRRRCTSDEYRAIDVLLRREPIRVDGSADVQVDGTLSGGERVAYDLPHAGIEVQRAVRAVAMKHVEKPRCLNDADGQHRDQPLRLDRRKREDRERDQEERKRRESQGVELIIGQRRGDDRQQRARADEDPPAVAAAQPDHGADDGEKIRHQQDASAGAGDVMARVRIAAERLTGLPVRLTRGRLEVLFSDEYELAELAEALERHTHAS